MVQHKKKVRRKIRGKKISSPSPLPGHDTSTRLDFFHLASFVDILQQCSMKWYNTKSKEIYLKEKIYISKQKKYISKKKICSRKHLLLPLSLVAKLQVSFADHKITGLFCRIYSLFLGSFA